MHTYEIKDGKITITFSNLTNRELRRIRRVEDIINMYIDPSDMFPKYKNDFIRFEKAINHMKIREKITEPIEDWLFKLKGNIVEFYEYVGP